MQSVFLRFLIISSLIAGGLTSCNNAADSRKRIDGMEQAVKAAPTDENVRPLLQQYNAYVKDNPKDAEWGSKFMYRAAQLYYRAGNCSQAVNLLDKALKDFDQSPNTANVIIFQAFLYDDCLGNSDKAKGIAKAFKERFPENPAIGYADIILLPEQEKLTRYIKEQQSKLIKQTATGKIEKSSADRLLRLTQSYVDKFPEDKGVNPQYLFEAGKSAVGTNQPLIAIQFFERIHKEYSESPLAPQCLFMAALEFQDKLKDFPNAKKEYETILSAYPKSDYADDATAAIEHLGKTDDEVVKGFLNGK
jgi:outer membrane protein assembly factor BamD (BamD/ComL family)